MNIFVLDNDPVKAAQYMDDQRVSKMIIESGQMMRAALGRHGMTERDCRQFGILTKSGTPWRITHKNHPCTLWAGDSRTNFMWLATHALALCREFEQRYLKEHACRQPIMHMIDWMDNIPEGDYTPFAQAMPDEYKHEDAVTAYRAYYHSKVHSPGGVRYRHTSPPDWWRGAEVIA
tara:strand:+ start:3379 stop:3906 length:528 start_codon:yes stop_codon:yes gene_type:complete